MIELDLEFNYGTFEVEDSTMKTSRNYWIAAFIFFIIANILGYLALFVVHGLLLSLCEAFSIILALSSLCLVLVAIYELEHQ